MRLSNSLRPCRYYFSAALVDNPMVGRLRIQIFGFLGVGALFMVSAGAYGPLTTQGGINTFQFIYFFSSFVVRPLPLLDSIMLRQTLMIDSSGLW